jgi:hypothetical protein
MCWRIVAELGYLLLHPHFTQNSLAPLGPRNFEFRN